MQTLKELEKGYFINEIVLYILLVPFFFPKGFGEYFPVYYNLYRTVLFVATVAILIGFIQHIGKGILRFKRSMIFMILYHISLFLITMFLQMGITEGIQKIFIAPALCIVCADAIKKNGYRFFKVISNILVVDFTLNILVFNEFLFQEYFLINNHVMFLGHVQVASQIGLLAVFIGKVLKDVYKQNTKGNILIFLSIINMVYSQTLASFISCILLGVGFFLIKHCRSNLLLDNPILSFFFLVLTNISVLYLTMRMNGSYFLYGYDISLSGRMFIWDKAMELINGHWLLGYGAYGVLIKVFWSEWTSHPEGANYAHNEIMQLLLDGGIILVCIFYIMLFYYLSDMKKAENIVIKRVATLIFCIFLSLSIVESISDQYFFFIYLSIIGNLPILSEYNNFRTTNGKRISYV